MSKPTISVAIACINEGPDLETTLACIIASKTPPNEIVVVDDASKSPIADRIAWVSRFTFTRVIRHNKSVGAGQAKSIGADAATGDIVIVMDSHMRPAFDWIDKIIGVHQKHPDSILCPISYAFEYPHAFDGRGCNMKLHESGCWDGVWKPHEPDDADGKMIGSVLGGCYAIPKKTLETIGGYARHSIGWGYEEEFLSVRAYIAGFDCRLVMVPVEHQYKRTVDRKDVNGFEWPGWTGWYNKHFAMATLWEAGRYENVYAPLMFKHFDHPDMRAALAKAADEITDMRTRIAFIRKRSDQDVGWMLGLPHADTQERLRQWWYFHGRK